MFSKKIKSAAATNQSGAMDAGNHFKTAVDNRDHFKNGASLKSLMSRGNIMQRIFLFFAGFCICATSTFAQDIIVTKDSKRIEAKVTEVNEDNIKYKIFDNQDGPVYTLSISRIASILYESGRVEVFDGEDKKPVTEPEFTASPSTTAILSSNSTNINCPSKVKIKGKYRSFIWGGVREFYPWFEENKKLGFDKRMIPFEYWSTKHKDDKSPFAEWTNGLYVNRNDQLIRFREGNDWNTKYYMEVPFQCIRDVKIGDETHPQGTIIGPFININNILDGITIKIIISDPNGGLKTLELKMLVKSGLKIGSPEIDAAKRCAEDIYNNLVEIKNKY